ncbi:MAG: DUF6502 family protein [Sterolibacterium sp.]
MRLSQPLIELLVREGVSYTQFASAFKTVFVGAAESVLTSNGAKVTDSSLSTLSGVHRKDVHVWREAGQPPVRAKNLSLAMAAFARWSSDPAYSDKHGKRKLLARHGKSGSFDALAYSISKDVRPNVVLQELLRLGVVRAVQGEGNENRLELCAEAFVPKDGTAEMLQVLADNVADHIASAVSNVSGAAPMLEQAVFAEGFTEHSVETLAALSRKIWLRGFKEIVREATKLNQRDEGRADATQRFRLGMYCYRGPVAKR